MSKMIRKQLKNAKDIIEALKQGPVMENDSFILKIENGIICRYDKTGKTVSVNSAIFPLSDNIWVEQEQEFKFELGKFYKTRDGGKAIYLFFDRDTCDTEKFYKVQRVGDCYGYHVYQNGMCSRKGPSGFDIVGEWEE